MRHPATTALVAFVLPCLAACARDRAEAPRYIHSGQVAGAAAGVHLISDLPNGEWHLPAGDFANTRFSPLSQIDAANVSGLRVISTFSTGIPRGHEGQPLVVGSTMYVVTPFPNLLHALDLTDPAAPLKWTFDPQADPRAVGIACCDVVNRGAVYADGKIIYASLDGQVLAVDANSGKEVWRAAVGNTNLGETITMAPLVIKNRVIVGSSGGELGVRGYISGLDLGTGKQAWRAYHTGPDEDVLIGPGFKPFYEASRAANLGLSTWPQDAWRLGGGTVWGWISYDPQLDLLYYGTGNPGPWNPDLRRGDNKWTAAIFARDPDDGQARWAHQLVPHDMWDYDEIMENVLVDMDWNGQRRKLLIHPGRVGYVFVFDRETGEMLSAEPFQPLTWASGYDLATGTPRVNDAMRTRQGSIVRGICPSSTGAKEWNPSAFSPRTALLYIPAHNTCMDYEATEANYIAGTPYLGASVRMYPGEGYQGELVAWDPIGAKPVWSIKDTKFPMYSGVLATGGDLVFFGTMDGWFKAVDARSGRELWQFKTGSGVIGNPMTYIGPDGRQYIAVYSGIGGWMGAVAFPSISIDDPYAALGVVGAMKEIKKYSAPGNMLYVFGF
jgi:PQQ-dependent dehydrogenase (methanol/ethanol family)